MKIYNCVENYLSSGTKIALSACEFKTRYATAINVDKRQMVLDMKILVEKMKTIESQTK